MRPPLALATLVIILATPAVAIAQTAGPPRQALAWEGQTGGLVTPFAYTAASPEDGVGWPAVSFYIMPAGDVVGTRFQLSLTSGLFRRVEIGYTKAAVSAGTDQDLGNLFDRGFQVVHGKATLLPENAGGSQAPAIAVGGLFRWQVNQLEDSLGTKTENGDVYFVVTKTLMQVEDLPILVSGGVRMTNAALYGMAGNAPGWTARGFAAGGVVIARRLFAGVEYAQQPSEVDGVPDIEIPATVAFFARLLPDVGRSWSVAAGLTRLAGEAAPGVDLKAEHCFTLNVTVHF